MSRRIHVGQVAIGDGAPVSVQSMTNTPTKDAAQTLTQIRALASCGCEIVRLAVPDVASAEALSEIVPASPVPLVADIHFNHDLALRAIAAGIHAVRINPGNIGSDRKVREVAEAAGHAGIPIRVGVNAGSLPAGLYERSLVEFGDPERALAFSLCEAAKGEVARLEACGFHDIAVSLKASSVPVTVAAYMLFSGQSDYPLHVGVTEAGTPYRGIIKSAAGIGTLLLSGVGDTIRVSLTADPCEEVRAGIALLEAIGLRETKPEIVSCPTCARTAYDLFGMTEKVERLVADLKSSRRLRDVRKIAVMGCVVNGPGEAKDADIGLAGTGDGRIMIFEEGRTVATLSEADALAYLHQFLVLK
ncbi:MAG: flavodoxin-dependent (E)-4-hydroxy-3-methylbut-2-enyl-diphosphate synthase [Lentisphaeria bacterium]|nr:flavodoxin-dependent (E)-4-hydroxy-3-methylbut-2-enyl-diphosphate synthase [Lentisphaeria bacterium]